MDAKINVPGVLKKEERWGDYGIAE